MPDAYIRDTRSLAYSILESVRGSPACVLAYLLLNGAHTHTQYSLDVRNSSCEAVRRGNMALSFHEAGFSIFKAVC